jgi:hypothetical protein
MSWYTVVLKFTLLSLRIFPIEWVCQVLKKKMSHMSHVSMYDVFILPDVPIDSISNKKLWKLKILLWINIFGWYLRKGVILTKDNLVKQN